jgi:hypothetical protein
MTTGVGRLKDNPMGRRSHRLGEKEMAFREDWTRIAQSIHSFISTFRYSGGQALERTGTTRLGHSSVRPVANFVRAPTEPRLLAEIERKRNPAYMSSLKNQMR